MKMYEKGGEWSVKVNHKITGAEREVMEVLWRYSEPVQTKELLEQMNLQEPLLLKMPLVIES